MALLANEDLDLERYLHQLMPAALTCCVARRLGAAPADDHWVCFCIQLFVIPCIRLCWPRCADMLRVARPGRRPRQIPLDVLAWDRIKAAVQLHSC